jgi:hypothetical protein
LRDAARQLQRRTAASGAAALTARGYNGRDNGADRALDNLVYQSGRPCLIRFGLDIELR